MTCGRPNHGWPQTQTWKTSFRIVSIFAHIALGNSKNEIHNRFNTIYVTINSVCRSAVPGRRMARLSLGTCGIARNHAARLGVDAGSAEPPEPSKPRHAGRARASEDKWMKDEGHASASVIQGSQNFGVLSENVGKIGGWLQLRSQLKKRSCNEGVITRPRDPPLPPLTKGGI